MSRLLVAVSSACLFSSGLAQSVLTVDANKPGVKISPMFYGLMTEEINHSYDGGLYAELIQNRSFGDDPANAVHWSLVQDGGASADMNLDLRKLKLHVGALGKGQRAGIANDGFWGVPVLPNTRYRARVDVDGEGPIDVSIESSDGKTVFAHTRIPHRDASGNYRAELRTGNVVPSASNRFVVTVEQPGNYAFRFVSLFPPTYHNRPNGNRPDLMKLLAGMHPAFLRLPGGNYLEGDDSSKRFLWANTVLDIAGRQGHQGPWGYRSSDGLGMLEFLEWCEDLHMEPVLAVPAGYTLNGQHVDPGSGLEGTVANATDNIEYVIGDAKKAQGIVRANGGHPKPFPLTWVEIGNEDSFDRSGSYDGRFAQFYDAIKARWPQLKIIATMPVHSRTPDAIDDHYYRSAAAMERDVHHYDNYPRVGPKIFVGEWASIEGRPTPTMQAALGDAAWLTGLERNSDLVVMESYAPLLVNVNRGAAQWPTNLIGYDGLTSFGSPSYYVQSMFAANAGDVVLPANLNVVTPAQTSVVAAMHGGVGLATWRTSAVYRNISVSHDGERLFPAVVGEGTKGWTSVRGQWTMNDVQIQQTSLAQNTLATAGDPSWGNYTYQLQARKVSGDEGFLIPFHVHGRDSWRWNVGGWGDTRTALERVEGGDAEQVGPAADVTVKPGHWYDIRIELQDGHIRGYLDGQLVTEATETPRPPLDPIYATASRDSKTGDVIVKVVNVSADAKPLTLDLRGASARGPVRGWQLTGKPEDQNSVAEPTKVAPKELLLEGFASGSTYNFPAYSVTVLRIPVQQD